MKTRQHALALVFLAVVTGCVYCPSLSNGFVWDDYLVVVDNKFIKSRENVPRIFSRSYLTSPSALKDLQKKDIGSGEVTFRPVVTASYFFDYALWKLNPFGYHLHNLALHIANVLLIYGLALLIMQSRWAALISGLVFALHPVLTEAVMGISFREDLQANLFFMSAFIFYILWTKNNTGKYFYPVSVTLYGLALFAKEMAITLPAVLMAYDYCFTFAGRKREFLSKALRRYGWFVMTGIFYLWVIFFVMKRSGEYHALYPSESFWLGALTTAKVLANYLVWFIFPFDIHPTLPDYQFSIHTVLSGEAWICVAFVVAILAVVVRRYRSSRTEVFFIFWFFVTLLPVLNIIPIQNIFAARYLYIPGAGLCLLTGFMVDQGIKKLGVRGVIVLKIAAVGILTVYCFLIWRHNIWWANEAAFRMEMIHRYPQNSVAHQGLAVVFYRSGHLKEARNELEMAMTLNPSDKRILYDLSIIDLKEGRVEDATEKLKSLIQYYPLYDEDAYNTYCSLLGIQEKFTESISCFQKAIALFPRYSDTYLNLATVYEKSRKTDMARKILQEAAGLFPGDRRIQERIKAFQFVEHQDSSFSR